MLRKQPAMEWRPTLGSWLLRTETPMPEWAVKKCIEFMLKVQAARRLGLMPGDTRDDLDASVKALNEGKHTLLGVPPPRISISQQSSGKPTFTIFQSLAY